ncbi:uncharacterized protein EURHEDRAFT_413107 [Aspergillus ruber CBS 135680]|uniref:Uncharacterized protein n=1 Tax=Aspergillus ruber (strain CBS 135680) TaxID=1388766 RepID=A0A017SCS2_ASPRC|nr:uncharacterized protein EURHEDRAFT_413107 [Aspergillus ruber CBS 135680]EYE94747.1 hypothetical protein EURHEDRAFT_413107 [Aspergillus ruber CBS 135680]
MRSSEYGRLRSWVGLAWESHQRYVRFAQIVRCTSVYMGVILAWDYVLGATYGMILRA